MFFSPARSGKVTAIQIQPGFTILGVCVRTQYLPPIISGWVAMLGKPCNLSSLESLCWSGVSLCGEKSFFGSFVKVLVAVLVECVFDHAHSTCFGSSSFASWPVWLGIWHVCLGEPKFSFGWERQIQPGFTILGVCENWIPPWNNFRGGGYAWKALQPLVSGSFVKVLVAVLAECVFDHVHSTCFGSSSFASWPVWLGIWHVCLGEPEFSFGWERQDWARFHYSGGVWELDTPLE